MDTRRTAWSKSAENHLEARPPLLVAGTGSRATSPTTAACCGFSTSSNGSARAPPGGQVRRSSAALTPYPVLSLSSSLARRRLPQPVAGQAHRGRRLQRQSRCTLIAERCTDPGDAGAADAAPTMQSGAASCCRVRSLTRRRRTLDHRIVLVARRPLTGHEEFANRQRVDCPVWSRGSGAAVASTGTVNRIDERLAYAEVRLGPAGLEMAFQSLPHVDAELRIVFERAVAACRRPPRRAARCGSAKSPSRSTSSTSTTPAGRSGPSTSPACD